MNFKIYFIRISFSGVSNIKIKKLLNRALSQEKLSQVKFKSQQQKFIFFTTENFNLNNTEIVR